MNIDLLLLTVIGIGVLFLGAGAGYFIRQAIAQKRKSSIEGRLKKLVEDSKIEAKETLFEAKEKAAKIVDEAKRDEKDRLSQIRRLEERILERESSLDRRAQEFSEREKEVADKIETLKNPNI